ncbi:HK97-gp10 family putative phage morphogenesis protein [Brevundimonas balnearis]|uniref:HK97-gp10 family putative phage morphogenesis protein n=1 Tax=Brevundimonas balnearis TaxID=1572858 RepID=A0ABV6R0Z2_9CAUL
MARTRFRAGDRDRAKALFRRLPKDVRRATQDALASSADELAEAVRYNVPVDHGDLKASVRWRRGAPRDKKARKAGRTEDKDLSVTVAAGDETAFYASFVEFGTAPSSGEAPRRNRNFKSVEVMTKGTRPHAGTPAQPFFFPTWRALRRRLVGKIKRAQAKAIRKASEDV